MATFSEIFQRIGKLSTTALYVLLCEDERLRAVSVQKLARTCRVSPKTMRWYLDELASYRLIERADDKIIICDAADGTLEVIHEFVAKIPVNSVWDPYLATACVGRRTSPEIWEKYLLDLYYRGGLSVKTIPAADIIQYRGIARTIFRLRGQTGIVERCRTLEALPGEFLLLLMKNADEQVLLRVSE